VVKSTVEGDRPEVSVGGGQETKLLVNGVSLRKVVNGMSFEFFSFFDIPGLDSVISRSSNDSIIIKPFKLINTHFVSISNTLDLLPSLSVIQVNRLVRGHSSEVSAIRAQLDLINVTSVVLDSFLGLTLERNTFVNEDFVGFAGGEKFEWASSDGARKYVGSMSEHITDLGASFGVSGCCESTLS